MGIAPRPGGRFERARRALLARLDRGFRSPWAGPGIGLVIFGLLFAARTLGLLEPLELRLYDQYLRWRAELRAPYSVAAERVALVKIQEADIARFGHPIPDRDLARALENLARLGPRAIGVDVYRDRPVGEGRDELSRVAARNPNIAFIELLAQRERDRIAPPPFLEGRPQAAASNMVIDADGVLRRGMVFVYDDDDQAHPSLAWWLAERYLAQESEPIEPGPGQDDPEGPRLPIRLGRGEIWRFLENDGGYRAAPDGDYQLLLGFHRNPQEFPSVGFGDVFDGKVDPELVRDRVVVLGTAAPSVKDDFFTPLSPLRHDGVVTKGIEVHGFVVDQLIRVALAGELPTRVASETEETLWMLAWCLAWGWIGVRVRSPGGLALVSVAGVALLALSFPLFLRGWWTPVVPPALAWLGTWGVSAVAALVLERHARDVLNGLLFSHVSEKVAQKLWRENAELAVNGRLPAQQACITVLMTDLEGFTKSSEKLEPKDVMSWLNEYMDAMVPIVESHDGLVDGYWGDAIKADFGAPEPRQTEQESDTDAVNAVRCALAMGAAMKQLILHWRATGYPAVRMRIGINTGPVVMGSQGSSARLKYTSMGDTVNVAARLEALDKEGFEAEKDPLACRILATAGTCRRLGTGFELQDLGEHPLKGKGATVRIYRVLGEARPDAVREAGSTPREEGGPA
jgi:adenylate cyclase